MEIPIYNWKESMSISTKLLEEDTFPGLFSWIWSQEQWTQSEPGHSVNFSDQTTSSSVKLELETTGLKVITLKELNSSTQFWTSPERKLKDVTASKVSKLLTLWEEEQDQAWELFLSLNSENNIPTE